MGRAAPRLLAVSSGHGDTAALDRWAAELAAAGVPALQLREKTLDDRSATAAARRVRGAAPGILLMVNRRADVALASGADGVHLPADGLPAAPLRSRFPTLRLGRSTHTLAEVVAARDEGLDYLVFGPVFETPSKPGPAAGLDGLRRAVETAGDLPVLAIGGIGPERLRAVLDCGAWGVAGIRAFASGALASGFLARSAA